MKETWTIIIIVLLMLSGTAALAEDVVVLDWGDCVREAAKYNPQLAASLQVVNQRKAQKWIATSPMLPQISAQASAGKTNTFSGGSGRSNNTYSAKGEQLLFDGFKTYNDFKSAEQDLSASQHSYTAASSDIRYNLRKAFTELLKAQALVPITQSIIARRKQNRGMIRLRYESGREHQGSLLLAEADLAQARLDHRKARRDISVAQYSLRKELGWKKDVPIRVQGRLKLQTPLRGKPDLRTIADNHPQVKRTASERSAAKYGLQAAKSEFFPTFKLAAEAGKIRSGGFSADDGWSVGVNASLPIFEGGRRIANTDRARARLHEVASGETSEYDRVLSSLESAWQKLKDAVQINEVQKKYLRADQVRAKIAKAQYANGLLIFDNWIIIEDNYVRSQKAYVNTQADMMIAEAEWIQARGEVLEYE
ncbi:MAG: TolC family protein [Thermoplasmata archaeon]|nr:TolC family protein [Thermoplasmata archaeon]